MKKIIASAIGLLIFIYTFNISANDVEKSTITLKPGLNVVSTPALLKGISFSNSGHNISFATLENHLWKAVNISNDNVGTMFTPLTGYIVRNDTNDDVEMTLSYETNLNQSQLLLKKELNGGWNLLGITTSNNPFNNIAYTTATTILDFTNGSTSNQIITGKTFQEASNFMLGKAYGVFTNTGSGIYGGWNNYTNLNGFSTEECQEICENDENSCPEECRSGILSENSVGHVTLSNNTMQTLYEGTITANKDISLNALYVYGDNRINEGDCINFYIYINEYNVSNFTLDDVTTSDVTYYRGLGDNTNINAGETVTFTIKAIFNGLYTESYNYGFKLGIYGNDILSYDINSVEISFDTEGESLSPGTIVSEEFKNAYNRANSNGILDEQIIDYTNLNDEISNADLTTIINNYAKTILNREIDTTKNCSFINTGSLTELQADGAIESCQLGLIQEEYTGISLNETGTLATISTLLSRALRNNKYDGVGSPNYTTHLQALNVAGIIKNIDNPEETSVLKGDVLVILMNSEGKEQYRRVINSYNFAMNNFNSAEDIYHNIKTGDRVIFVVRHSERINDCGSEGGLTNTGIELARGVGTNLKGAPFEDTSTDFYGSSTVKRTVQTSYFVGEGRESEALQNELDSDAWRDYEYVNHSGEVDDVVYGRYFTDGHSDTNINTFYEHHKDDVNYRSIIMVNTLCKITQGHPFSWITSHDWVAMPLAERATDEAVSFGSNERGNFMQGIAIVAHPDGGREVYPVKSLASGKMNNNPPCH